MEWYLLDMQLLKMCFPWILCGNHDHSIKIRKKPNKVESTGSGILEALTHERDKGNSRITPVQQTQRSFILNHIERTEGFRRNIRKENVHFINFQLLEYIKEVIHIIAEILVISDRSELSKYTMMQLLTPGTRKEERKRNKIVTHCRFSCG